MHIEPQNLASLPEGALMAPQERRTRGLSIITLSAYMIAHELGEGASPRNRFTAMAWDLSNILTQTTPDTEMPDRRFRARLGNIVRDAEKAMNNFQPEQYAIGKTVVTNAREQCEGIKITYKNRMRSTDNDLATKHALEWVDVWLEQRATGEWTAYKPRIEAMRNLLIADLNP